MSASYSEDTRNADKTRFTELQFAVGDYQIECVTEFPYLGSVIASYGRMQPDIDQRIARASRAFGKHYAGQRSEIGTLELKSSLCPLHPAV